MPEPADIRHARIKALTGRMNDKATTWDAWRHDAIEALGNLEDGDISREDKIEIVAILADSGMRALAGEGKAAEKTEAADPAPVESPAPAESIGDPEE